MKKYILSLLLGIIFLHPIYSQNEEINVAGLVFLNYKETLPEKICAKKTIVLINTTKISAEQTFYKTVEPLIKEAHSVFTKAGIDVVGYYSLKQVFAGKESQYRFAEAWEKREIENIIIISRIVFKKKKKELSRFVILVSTFNKKPSLFSNGQTGWKAQGKVLAKALAKVATAANKYEHKNLLLNDSPEYFNGVKMVFGEHVKSYLTNLDFGKLAVPKFKIIAIPNPKPSGIINNLVANQVKKSNTLNATNNNILEDKMKNYKYKYELVDPSISDENLYKKGFSYVLLRLYSPGISIKKLLNYKINEDREVYTTQIYKNGKLTIRRIPVNGLVYKYYIKHLPSGNIYLGSKWDADETWGEALDHMLYNIKIEMKK